jgi:hypothetical protein
MTDATQSGQGNTRTDQKTDVVRRADEAADGGWELDQLGAETDVVRRADEAADGGWELDQLGADAQQRAEHSGCKQQQCQPDEEPPRRQGDVAVEGRAVVAAFHWRPACHATQDRFGSSWCTVAA